MRKRISLFLKWILSIFFCLFVVATSVWAPTNQEDSLRLFTRPYEFDYFGWTIDAFVSKIAMQGLGLVHHLNDYQQRKVIHDYFLNQGRINQLNIEIEGIYSNPEISDPDETSRLLRGKLELMTEKQRKQALLAEAVLQDQINKMLYEMDLSELPLSFPPVLFHISQLPRELVVSPRDTIRQEASISLTESITITEIEYLEEAVETHTKFSALVVSLGGMGTYPTMVINTTDLAGLIETVAHEWIHNYLTFKPLGIRYEFSSELRTMNETTASIAGKEISRAVMQRFDSGIDNRRNPLYDTVAIGFYPELEYHNQPFDFQTEMYHTRLRVDELLSDGKIDEAEKFMQGQRTLFWENGYRIRKLNQAYFAFHGAYADQPYSAAGDDPVGADVRMLRQRSSSLSQFIHLISQVKSYDDLKNYLDSF